MAIEKETEEKIQQLQLIEQSLQTYLMQKQQFQKQLLEIESAIKELKGSKEAYKIVGNIMVNAKSSDLLKEQEENKKHVELRIKNLEKQEERIRQKASNIQSEVMEKIGNRKE